MKLKDKKIIVNSFLLAFFVSFVINYILFPDLGKFLYTNINSGVSTNISLGFLFKILVILLGQTSLLGSIFYVIAKKMFLK